MLDLDGSGIIKTSTDEYCYYVKDIASYLYDIFQGKESVLLTDLWSALNDHPIFPSDGYKREIKAELKNTFGVSVSKQTVNFADRGTCL